MNHEVGRMVLGTIWKTWSIWSSVTGTHYDSVYREILKYGNGYHMAVMAHMIPVFLWVIKIHSQTAMCSGSVLLHHRPWWLCVSRDFQKWVMVTIWLSGLIWSQKSSLWVINIHSRKFMCSGSVWVCHRPWWLCVSGDFKYFGRGEQRALRARMVPLVFILIL